MNVISANEVSFSANYHIVLIIACLMLRCFKPQSTIRNRIIKKFSYRQAVIYLI